MDQKKRDAVQKLGKLYSMSNAELLREVEAAMSHAGAEGFDPDDAAACLRILQERDPVMEDFDPWWELQSLPLDPKWAAAPVQ